MYIFNIFREIFRGSNIMYERSHSRRLVANKDCTMQVFQYLCHVGPIIYEIERRH